MALVVAYETAMHFNGPAIDGPFQLYNGLRRIAAGFRPGVDFQFFHGLGVLYLHYLPFRLFGAGFAGSELARELVTVVAYPVVYLLVFRGLVGDWRRALCLATAALALSYALKLLAVNFALNGSLGLRSALPTLIPVLAIVVRRSRLRSVAIGVALGLSLFISTEQGLAALAAFVLVSAVAIIQREERRARLLESMSVLVFAIVTLVVCLVIIGGFSGMRGALRYNFRLVPMDQYWYFGVPPNPFIPSWGAGIRMLVTTPFIGGAVVLAVVASAVYLHRLWVAQAGAARERAFAMTLLAVYGLVSCASLLGVFTPAYAQPCWRTLVIVGLVELSLISERIDARAGHGGWLGASRGVAGVALAASLWTLAGVDLIARSLRAAPHTLVVHVFGHERFVITGIWPDALRIGQQVIDAHRSPTGALPTLWSTYAGWLEARNGMFQPSFDYIIHVLGPENRRAYVEQFRAMRPTLVQTVHAGANLYEPWIENASWDFYAEVLQWYSVTAETPWSIIWERRATPAPSPVVIGTTSIPAGATQLQLPAIPENLRAPVTLLELDMEYDARNPLRVLPVVGALPRYLVGFEGALSRLPVSLDPYVRRVKFPLLVDPRATVTLHFQTLSLLPGASLAPRSISVSVRPIDAGNQVWLKSLVR